MSLSRWPFDRLVRTLDFFGSISVVSPLKAMVFGADSPPPPTVDGDTIFDFASPQPEQLALWGALDDVVMGGVSSSGLRAAADGVQFTGVVSTDNSGGFTSVRTRNFEPPLNLGGYAGIELDLKGDGQRYKFFLRDATGWDTVAYAQSFDTVADQWITVQVPFQGLTPVFRAKTQPAAPPLNPSRIRSLQLMLSKFEYDRQLNPHFMPGPFCLSVQRISAYR